MFTLSKDKTSKIQTKYEQDTLKECFKKYRDLRVPKEDLGELCIDDEDIIAPLGNLPVLIINLRESILAED